MKYKMCRMQCVLALVALYVGLAHSWDFAVSVGDRLIFYTNETKIHTVSFKSQNLTALTYDEVHNMILYVDKQNNNDTICGYDISSTINKCFIKRNGRNITGLAFDPILEILFFSDANERSINFISLKPGSTNNVYGNLLFKTDDGISSDIAVDSCKGHIYWINKNTDNIESAKFDGVEKKVFIHSSLPKHQLTIDLQTQKMYFIDCSTSSSYCFLTTIDLITGRNSKYVNLENKNNPPIAMTLSKDSVFVIWSGSYKSIWQFSKNILYGNRPKVINAESPIMGIVANYKIKERIQGIENCETLMSLILNTSNSVTNDSESEIAAESGPFCVRGIKVDGQSLCTCTPGYTGERCDVSVCENYCLQGNCTVNDGGLHKCRCNAGYSGDRCEVNTCHEYCLNNGTCSLNEKSEPVCQCVGDYGGDRCDISVCRNYCIQGNCSVNDEGLPKCRCNVGYSGDRCEVNTCHGYCLNNGTCSLNEMSEPVCQCIGRHEGSRCEAVKNNNVGPFCVRGIKVDGQSLCTCTPGYIGEQCDVSVCENYCFQGSCSVNDEGLPKCRCDVGYSGVRCEINACYGYCLNNGDCFLNEEDEPACQCIGSHEGSRCEAVKNNNTFTTTPNHYSSKRNLTLADLLSSWRKPTAKISVIVEV